MNGSQRALEICAVNLCGWSLNKPETVLNIAQHIGPPVDTRAAEQVKAHLVVELQRAVWAEAKRQEIAAGGDVQALPPLPPGLPTTYEVKNR